jgi:hypothetical protein
VVVGHIPLTPADAGHSATNQTKGPHTGRWASTLEKSAAEVDPGDQRVWAADLKKFRVKAPPVNLPPVEIPAPDRLGKLVEARKLPVGHVGLHALLGCRRDHLRNLCEFLMFLRFILHENTGNVNLEQLGFAVRYGEEMKRRGGAMTEEQQPGSRETPRRSKMGRPPLPREQARCERVVTFVTTTELEVLRRQADETGMSVSAVVHQLMSLAVRKDK